jgi:hypothetical protein
MKPSLPPSMAHNELVAFPASSAVLAIISGTSVRCCSSLLFFHLHCRVDTLHELLVILMWEELGCDRKSRIREEDKGLGFRVRT